MKTGLSWGRNTSTVTFRCPCLLKPDREAVTGWYLMSRGTLSTVEGKGLRNIGSFLVSHSKEVMQLGLQACSEP